MVYQAENIDARKHCFYGCQGGVSTGKYASLNTNINSQDSRLNVERNFSIIANNFGLEQKNMLTIKQSVTSDVIWVNKPSRYAYAADAAVTDKENILLCIKTADCAPVLLADYKHGVIGAAHAGWRGAVRGVVENAVKMMLTHGAQTKDIAVAIGPCIQASSFAVKDDMRRVFLEQSPENVKYFTTTDMEIYYFDLQAYLKDRLLKLKIENISVSNIDTYTAVDEYFSYRRYCHLNMIEIPHDYPTQFSCLRL